MVARTGNLRVLRTYRMRLRCNPGADGIIPEYILAEPRTGYRMPEGDA